MIEQLLRQEGLLFKGVWSIERGGEKLVAKKKAESKFKKAAAPLLRKNGIKDPDAWEEKVIAERLMELFQRKDSDFEMEIVDAAYLDVIMKDLESKAHAGSPVNQ